MESKLTRDQKILTDWKLIDGGNSRIRCKLRYDDECGNGHNTFSITAEIQDLYGESRSFGCLHDEIAKHFPEYAHMIKWHLVSSDGPMHYVANALYHVSDRDCWGRRKGEPSIFSYGIKFEGFPITIPIRGGYAREFCNFLSGLGEREIADLTVEEVQEKGSESQIYKKYTFTGFLVHWYECPFNYRKDAEDMILALQSRKFEIVKTPTQWSEGKERDLNAARSVAVWPEATDEELLSDDLQGILLRRLPDLMDRFRADIEKLGFTY